MRWGLRTSSGQMQKVWESSTRKASWVGRQDTGLQCHQGPRTVPLSQKSLPTLTQHMARHGVLLPCVSLRCNVEQDSRTAANKAEHLPWHSDSSDQEYSSLLWTLGSPQRE